MVSRFDGVKKVIIWLQKKLKKRHHGCYFLF
jgi:hypothetical protein